ncbi:hypothetical protein CGRA01v4_03653 [Colletotrichum graminicola]|nr:hypothetical protein CGRA01v4_03653 [Colletotrichum graminicola]
MLPFVDLSASLLPRRALFPPLDSWTPLAAPSVVFIHIPGNTIEQERNECSIVVPGWAKPFRLIAPTLLLLPLFHNTTIPYSVLLQHLGAVINPTSRALPSPEASLQPSLQITFTAAEARISGRSPLNDRDDI